MRENAFLVSFVLTLVAVIGLPPSADAQTPHIAVYFDPGFSIASKNCPGQVLDVWYVAGVGFNSLVTGAEFAIEYPPAVQWVSDLGKPPVSIGQTPTGISMGYATPLNGYAPVGLCQVQVFWVCEGCAPPYYGNLIQIVPHAGTGFLGWTDEHFTE